MSEVEVKEWEAQESAKVHANEQIIVVKNEGEEKAEWRAGGRPVLLPPGGVQRMPRWVFLLGLKYPGHEKLKELAPGEGSKEYEKAQKIALENQIKLRKAQLAREQEELKDLEASLKKPVVPEKPPEK